MPQPLEKSKVKHVLDLSAAITPGAMGMVDLEKEITSFWEKIKAVLKAEGHDIEEIFEPVDSDEGLIEVNVELTLEVRAKIKEVVPGAVWVGEELVLDISKVDRSDPCLLGPSDVIRKILSEAGYKNEDIGIVEKGNQIVIFGELPLDIASEILKANLGAKWVGEES